MAGEKDLFQQPVKRIPMYETILYSTEGAMATITLNRPEELNTIIPPMPD